MNVEPIAGHYFARMSDGRYRCTCGKTWLDLVAARELWRVGAEGIAHSGGLTESELNQLIGEEDRIWALLTSAASSPS